MWKKITVVAGGMALAVALPFVALAITTEEFPDVITPADAATEMVQATEAVQATTQIQTTEEVAPTEPTGPWVSPNAVDPISVQQNEQVMVRQQLRIHAETGPPEGVEPTQQRLHVDDPLGAGPGSDSAGQHMGNGNPNAPMVGAGTGDCAADGAECPNADDPSTMNQNTNQNMNQNQEMVKGNPDAPMAGAGTGDPADCPNDGEPLGGQGAGNGGRGGRNG
jgi:hypothetical protein